MKVEDFHDLVRDWWQGYLREGSPGYVLAYKLTRLKEDLFEGIGKCLVRLK